MCEMTDEEYMEKMMAEEDLMNAFFKSPPLEVQMGGKRELLNYIAQTALELYELGESYNTQKEE